MQGSSQYHMKYCTNRGGEGWSVPFICSKPSTCISLTNIFGHHRKVATEEDPASAEKGITVYRFFLRSYFGAYRSVYRMEKESGKPLCKNLMIWSMVANLVFCTLIYMFYDAKTLVFFVAQVLGAVFFLEVINYIEHYGLRRKKLSDGSYEKVTIKHSWNSPHRFSNYLFFKLQRHSDHH